MNIIYYYIFKYSVYISAVVPEKISSGSFHTQVKDHIDEGFAPEG